jgi:hypothetical protein
MRLGWLGLAVACGKDIEGSPSSPDVEAPGCDVPTFDLPNADCDQRLGAYTRLLDAASDCEADADCQVLDTRCDVMFIGACTMGANRCIDQGDIDEIVDAWAPCDDDLMSSCPEPCEPTLARCDAGHCIAAPAG